MLAPLRTALVLWLLLGLCAGCGEGDEPPLGRGEAASPPPPGAEGELPPHARPDLVAMLRADAEAARDPSDGGGRAWLEGEARATAHEAGRWTLVYEAGPRGVAEGGTVFLMTSPLWGWSTPQTQAPDVHGYTEVSTDAPGVELETATVDAQLLAVGIRGRALAPGERIRFVLGAGPAGAGADRFAEHEERIWVAVDGDGDGVRALLEDSPRLDVAAGRAAQLHLILPSTARPGQTVRLAVALLDAWGDAGTDWSGQVVLEPLPEGVQGPDRVSIPPGAGGIGRAELVVSRPAVVRLRARAGELRAESNPLVVGEGPRVLWGDLHGHSQLSDGTGTPEDYFHYARDVAGLDVAALTDHDHWGLLPLDGRPERWKRIRDAVARFHEPGRFVALLGYEWTSWIHGHRHVLYFSDDGPIFSSLDEATDDPRELWAALGDRPALTFAHHSAGGPIPTDWSIPPDPHFEPLTEVVSVHGSSEALDAPGLIYNAVPGNFVRDQLDRGYHLGFVGSGDSHDGHPGLAHLASPSGGLAGIVAEAPTREAVLEALRARRTFATNGPRILLRAALDGHPQGAVVPRAGLSPEPVLRVQVVAPGEIAYADVIRSGRVAEHREVGRTRVLQADWPLEDLAVGEYVYVRVVQIGGGAAWSSPFFID